VLAADTKPALNGIFDGLTGIARVAVAVSGGSDSMALLRLVQAWQQSSQGPRDIYALTVDHGLRSESAAEAQQVAQWCAALQVQHIVLAWQGLKPTTGLQAKGRTARYDLMSDWCRSNKVSLLMTGHTADDQAETVYMRLKRTASDRSLSGIWPENEWRGIKLMRPLLATRRQALRDYLLTLKQGWLEDPSNSNSKFERVQVRQALAGTDATPLQAMAELAQQRVRETDERVLAWLKVHMTVDAYAVVRLARQHFEREPSAVQHAILSWALTAAGDGQLPEAQGLEQATQAILAGRDQRRSLSGALVCPRRHVIEIMREPGRMRVRWVAVPESGRLLFDNRFEVFAPAGSQCGPQGEPPLLKRPKDVPAFAFRALPTVKLAGGEVVSAVKSGRSDISAKLCERFRL
jgi:tRNA(Ile)-lysidine synthase